MAKVAYVMLAHERPDRVADHVEIITSADPAARVFIHYDAAASPADFQKLAARLQGNGRAVFIDQRVRCGWGEFGLVQAPLNALRQIEMGGSEPDYVYLISGACLPIRPLAELNRFLDERAGSEFIQARDDSWMLAGLRQERYRFYFPLSFKKRRRLFNLLVRAQRLAGVRRTPPAGLEPRFGSQWWCLTWKTCRSILGFVDAHPEVVRFFRSTWIPDESFFQTLVYRLADPTAIAYQTLTLYQWTAKGKPVVFFDEHERWLNHQGFFFARKIAPEASDLTRRLAARAAEPDSGHYFGDTGHAPPFYSATIWARNQKEQPGQMFRLPQRRDSSPGALSCNARPYLMLFGPGSATRIAARALHRRGVPVLGRVFHPHRVGFADYGLKLDGLLPSETAIRDFDTSLYLCRVLSRAPNCPVLEHGLFDASRPAFCAFDDPNCLFVFCLPRPDLFGFPPHWDSATWRMYLALGLFDRDNLHGVSDFAQAIGPESDEALLAYALEQAVNSTADARLVEWLKSEAFADLDKPNLLVLPWSGNGQGRDRTIEQIAKLRTQWVHGARLDVQAVEWAAAALGDSDVTEAEIAAPPQVGALLFEVLHRRSGSPTVSKPRADVIPVAAWRS